MMNNILPYLSGGIFFSLLSEIKRKGSVKRMSDVTLMSNLGHVITGRKLTIDKSLTSYTSRYRHCTEDGGSVIPFTDKDVIKEFDVLVKNNPAESIFRMKKLAKNCLNTDNEDKAIQIIDSILRIIRDDDSIDDSSEFFILQNNKPISKKNMLLRDNFDFYPFLIGVLHYIITKPTDNKKGQATFEKLFPNHGRNGPGKINTNFLTPLGHDISVRIDKQDLTAPCKIEDDMIVSHLKGNQRIKFLYKSDSLEEWEEELINNFDPSIIDLNKNPEGYRVNDKKYSIGRLTSDFRFSSYFVPKNRVEMVKVDFTLGNESFFDFTSLKNWESESEIRKILFRGQYNCTAWIRIESQPNNEYFTKIIAVRKFL